MSKQITQPGWTQLSDGSWHHIAVADDDVYLDGQICNVQVFGKCLTSQKVKWLYNKGDGLAC